MKIKDAATNDGIVALATLPIIHSKLVMTCARAARVDDVLSSAKRPPQIAALTWAISYEVAEFQ
jgi:hypothetical protein